MKRFVRLWNGILLAALALTWAGCGPVGVSSQDSEEKEPHYLAGKSRVNTMDFKGAIESFEKAIESNPSSAAAHFELGWLFDRREGDAAAAIYHYEKFLKLRPKAENAEIVRQHILACKQELARTVSLGPINDRVQKDLESIADDNKKLREDNKALNEEVMKWRILFAASGGTNRAAAAESRDPVTRAGTAQQAVTERPPVSRGATPQRSVTTPRSTTTPQRSMTTPRSTTYGSGRTHLVRPGETMTSISRRYGIKLSTLTWANPGLDPKRLRAGQVIKIP